MNLFILDLDPVKAAQLYQDIHVNKIIIEGCQLLAAAYPLERLEEPDCPRTQKGTPRTHGHYRCNYVSRRKHRKSPSRSRDVPRLIRS